MSEQTVAAPRWLDAREQAAWRAFLDMQARLNGQINRELQDRSGLSSSDFAVLVQLSEHPQGRMRVLELARALRWEKSRLSHQLTRMGHRDLLERSNCDEDRRGAWVALTEHGRTAVQDAAPHHVETVRRYLFDELTGEQIDLLASISRTVIDRIDADCAKSGGCPDETV